MSASPLRNRRQSSPCQRSELSVLRSVNYLRLSEDTSLTTTQRTLARVRRPNLRRSSLSPQHMHERPILCQSKHEPKFRSNISPILKFGTDFLHHYFYPYSTQLISVQSNALRYHIGLCLSAHIGVNYRVSVLR